MFRVSEAVSAGLGPTLVSAAVDLRAANVFLPVLDLLLNGADTDGGRAERYARETTSARPHRETRAEDEAARVAQVGTMTVAGRLEVLYPRVATENLIRLFFAMLFSCPASAR